MTLVQLTADGCCRNCMRESVQQSVLGYRSFCDFLIAAVILLMNQDQVLELECLATVVCVSVQSIVHKCFCKQNNWEKCSLKLRLCMRGKIVVRG